ILLRESIHDYGPVPFRFFHHWLELDGLYTFVSDTWRNAPEDGSNGMRNMTGEQRDELERKVTIEEIKTAVWNCDVYAAVNHFFINGDIPAGCNLSFIALIPKVSDANLVKDFRPISLIGSIYKIIAKILMNRLINVLGDIVSEVQSAFVAGRQILDDPFILNEVLHWCSKKKQKSLIFKIQCCLKSSRGSILVNGSPTDEFQFYKGLKQGDPLSPFLFILIMKSLHLSFQRVVDVELFRGINLNHSLCLSHMFYADDAIFMGQWSDGNITTLIHVLECFFHASGLKINLCKSSSMARGRGESEDSTLQVENENVIHWRSTYLAEICVRHEIGSKKVLWVKWNNVLTDKKHGGLGVSSLYALNRGLMIKWLWKFFVHKDSIWTKVIKAIHGVNGNVNSSWGKAGRSCWLAIVDEVWAFHKKGVYVFDFMNLKLGNGEMVKF
nr:RNA-directed DNA polymerase, eukaryota [Tanacetum cinerariifolium]